jgi:hypothetical protein
LQVVGKPHVPLKRIGLEAGPLSQWIFSALAEAGLNSKHTRLRSGRLIPAAPAVPAATAKQQNDKYDDDKRGGVHGELLTVP